MPQKRVQGGSSEQLLLDEKWYWKCPRDSNSTVRSARWLLPWSVMDARLRHRAGPCGHIWGMPGILTITCILSPTIQCSSALQNLSEWPWWLMGRWLQTLRDTPCCVGWWWRTEDRGRRSHLLASSWLRQAALRTWVSVLLAFLGLPPLESFA